MRQRRRPTMPAVDHIELDGSLAEVRLSSGDRSSFLLVTRRIHAPAETAQHLVGLAQQHAACVVRVALPEADGSFMALVARSALRCPPLITPRELESLVVDRLPATCGIWWTVPDQVGLPYLSAEGPDLAPEAATVPDNQIAIWYRSQNSLSFGERVRALIGTLLRPLRSVAARLPDPLRDVLIRIRGRLR